MERTPRHRDELATNMQVDKRTVDTDVARAGENGVGRTQEAFHWTPWTRRFEDAARALCEMSVRFSVSGDCSLAIQSGARIKESDRGFTSSTGFATIISLSRRIREPTV